MKFAPWCLTLWDPMDLQPARLLSPWNSPGKNTGVSSHSLLQGIFLTEGLNLGLPHCKQNLFRVSHQECHHIYVCCAVLSHLVISNSLRPHGMQLTRLLRLWNSPGKNTEMCCYVLLQGIFTTQGLNPGHPYCRRILYHLSHQGSPFLTFTIPSNCTNGDYALKEKLSPVEDTIGGEGWWYRRGGVVKAREKEGEKGRSPERHHVCTLYIYI